VLANLLRLILSIMRRKTFQATLLSHANKQWSP
jgi:hypothetical protein